MQSGVRLPLTSRLNRKAVCRSLLTCVHTYVSGHRVSFIRRRTWLNRERVDESFSLFLSAVFHPPRSHSSQSSCPSSASFHPPLFILHLASSSYACSKLHEETTIAFLIVSNFYPLEGHFVVEETIKTRPSETIKKRLYELRIL